MAKVVLLLLVYVFISFCGANLPFSVYRSGNNPLQHFYKRGNVEALMKPCLKHINELRSKHNANPLSWDQFMVGNAAKWAKHLHNSGIISKDPQPYSSDLEGENVAKIEGGGSPAHKCIKAVNSWYAQKSKYISGGGCKSENGVKEAEDFSRLVWKNIDKVALVVEGDIVDARFFPPGNFEDDFAYDVEC